MQNLTLQELIILVAVIAAVVSIVTAIVKGSLKLIAVAVICCILFSGFTWLPEKVKEWTGSDIDPTPISQYVNTEAVENKVDEVKNKADEYMDGEGQTWIVSAKTLWNKIMGGDGTIDNGTIENTEE